MKLTKRGWIVLVIVPIGILLILFTHVTRDVCWTGAGYGSCSQWIDETIQKGSK